MIFKPAVASAPLIVTDATDGVISTSAKEIVALHYLNTTAGAGRVDIWDGTDANKRIVMGAAAQNGTDDFCPAQPIKFNKIDATFITGTGFLTIITN